ncbi:hypothetical protein ACQ4M4_27715 [Leptolyngbya sp. AN02str]|uniref:hypothetical protein n=1 Tax=Leptolyngbya sp. AN02str TaxID=3423363 RepID=UPI003D312FF9
MSPPPVLHGPQKLMCSCRQLETSRSTISEASSTMIKRLDYEYEVAHIHNDANLAQ